VSVARFQGGLCKYDYVKKEEVYMMEKMHFDGIPDFALLRLPYA